MADPTFGVNGLKTLPKADPAATNVLDNQPDVNLPDATGSVSGTFDFITAFFTNFVNLLSPPMVSESDKQDLEDIKNDPNSSESEKNQAQQQLNAANMVNVFSSPFVRLIILTYIVIIILQILRRIPGVRGVPSMSSIANGLFGKGNYAWTDQLQIISGFFSIHEAINFEDETYIENERYYPYVNVVGAEIKEQDGKHYPSYGLVRDGGSDQHPIFKKVVPCFDDTIISSISNAGYFVPPTIKSSARYYLKLNGGKINVGSVEEPSVYELSSKSIRKDIDCEPLLLGPVSDGEQTVKQRAIGRQVEIQIDKKIKNGGTPKVNVSMLGLVKNKPKDLKWSAPNKNLEFEKKATLIGENLESTDRMYVSDITFKEGKIVYGWDVEKLTKPNSEEDPYKESFVVSDWDGGEPDWPSGNDLKFFQNNEYQSGWGVVRFMLGGLKRTDGKQMPLYEGENDSDDATEYTAKYVEIWAVQKGYRDPRIIILKIKDESENGYIYLGSNDKLFESTGLNSQADYYSRSDYPVQSDIRSAVTEFIGAISSTSPSTFWNHFWNGIGWLRTLSNALGTGYAQQMDYFKELVEKNHKELLDYYNKSDHSSITFENRSMATAASNAMDFLSRTATKTGNWLDDTFSNMDSDGDSSNLLFVNDSTYFMDSVDLSNCTLIRYEKQGSTDEEREQYWNELYALIRSSENNNDIYRTGEEVVESWNWGTKEILDPPESLAVTLVGDHTVHFVGKRRKIKGYLRPMKVGLDYSPEFKTRFLIFGNGTATVENSIGIDTIGDNYPPTKIIDDIPTLVFSTDDPCTQPQASMDKKMAMLLENDADQFTVMAAFGCCYTDDLWDKFQELKKLRRHMVRN